MVEEIKNEELPFSDTLEQPDSDTIKVKKVNTPPKINSDFAAAGSYWDQSIPSKRRRSSINRNDRKTTSEEAESNLFSESLKKNENDRETNLENDVQRNQPTKKGKETKKRKASSVVDDKSEKESEPDGKKANVEEVTVKNKSKTKEHQENQTKKATSSSNDLNKKISPSSTNSINACLSKEEDKKPSSSQKRSKTGKEILNSSSKLKKSDENDLMEIEDKKQKKKEKNFFHAEEEEVFHLNEICIARDAGRLYEAKILKVHEVEEDEDFDSDTDSKDAQKNLEGQNEVLSDDKGNKVMKRTRRHYFIHYNGWKPKYDIWVQSFELLKKTDENISTMKNQAKTKKKIQEELLNAKLAEQAKRHQEREERKNKARLEKQREKDMERNTRTAAPRLDVIEDKEDEPVRLNQSSDVVETKNTQLKLGMPFTLKKMLVEDWEAIVRKGRLVNLPKEKTDTITNILNGYLASKKEALVASQIKSLQELCSAVKEYFNAALPAVLLYRHERKQYDALFVDNNSPKNLKRDPHFNKSENNPVDIYGVEHFLRLFVRLPALIRPGALTPAEINNLQGKLNDLLRYIQKNYKTLFIEKYEEQQSTFNELFEKLGQPNVEVPNDRNDIHENQDENLSSLNFSTSKSETANN